MNRFIIKVFLLFVLGFIILLILNYVVFTQIILNNEFYKINTNINTLIIGDSHTETAIDPEYLSNCINISESGESMFHTYYKLKRLLSINSNIDNIILGFSYHTLSSYNEDKIKANRHLLKYYIYLDRESLHYLTFNFESLNLLLKDIFSQHLYYWIVSKVKKKRYSLISGEYYALNKSFLGDSTNTIILKKFFYKENYELKRLSYLLLNYFRRSIDLCIKNEKKVFLINTPLHKSYYSKIPQKYIGKYNSIIAELKLLYSKQIIILNYKDSIMGKDFYYDGDHLNKKGSVLFSKELAHDLKEEFTFEEF